MSPKITVIIPTYNSENYICSALDCVFNQTYTDFEVLVVDDGSTDATKQILNKYNGKIKYFYQINKGPAAARNKGIKEAEGKYIAFLDSDDLWLPQRLEKSVNFLEENNFDWVCSAVYRKKMGDTESTLMRFPEKYYNIFSKRINLLNDGLFFFSDLPIFPGSILARKKCFEQVGLFDEGFNIGEDTDMWLRFEERGLSGGYFDEPLFIYQINNGSLTKSKKFSGLLEHIHLAEKHAKILGMKKILIRKSYSQFLWRCADLLFVSGKYLSSLKCLLKSFILFPEAEKLKKLILILKKYLV